MTESINWTVTAAVDGGPKVSGTNTIEVDAYDKIGVVVAAQSQTQVQVQPGSAGQVQFLLVKADPYSPSLTYRVNQPDATPIPLDTLQLFNGAGAVSLLDPSPKTFFFSNGTENDTAVAILVGRNAATVSNATDEDDETGDSDGGGDSETGETDGETDDNDGG